MQITKKVKGQFVIFSISGNLDMNNVKFVKRIFDDEVNKGTKYVAIDMKNLSYIDSSGIGSFIGLMSKLRQVGGQVILLNMNPEIERIFSMTKLLAFFKVYKSEEEFLSSTGETSTPEGKEPPSTPSTSSPDYSF